MFQVPRTSHELHEQMLLNFTSFLDLFSAPEQPQGCTTYQLPTIG